MTVLRCLAVALLLMAGVAQADSGDSIEFPGRYKLTLHPSIKALNCRSGPGKQHPPIEWLSSGVIVDVREVHATPEVWALTQWECYVRARKRYLTPTEAAPTAVVNEAVSVPAAAGARRWSTGSYTVATQTGSGHLNCRAAPGIEAAVFAVYANGDHVRVIGVTQPEDPWLLTDEECYVKGNSDYLRRATH